MADTTAWSASLRRQLPLAGVLLLPWVGMGLAQTISKVAGTHPLTDDARKGAYSGDGGPADEAHLYWPTSVFVGADGSLYIADTLNNRIRRVDPEGIITTVAGNREEGFSGDGGPATQARLNGPGGLSVDATGSLYIADTWNHRIRRVDPHGTISTIAGNGERGISGDGAAAVRANLGAPGNLFLDGAGNIYVVSSHLIRRVDRDGITTTVAGSSIGYSGDGGLATQASIGGGVRGVFVDNEGNLLIADTSNHRIRRVNSEGIITTVAGNGERGISGDGGPAVEAGLHFPISVFVDDAGNLYIADDSGPLTITDPSTGRSSRIAATPSIRRVDRAGIIRTVVGGGERGRPSDAGATLETALGGPTGVFVDRIGDLYFADSDYNLVLRVEGLAAPTVLAGTLPAPLPEVDTTPPVVAATSPVDLTSVQIRVTVDGQVLDWPLSAPDEWTIELSATSTPAFDTEYRITVSQGADRAGNVGGDVLLTLKTRADLQAETDLGIITTVAGTGTADYSGDHGAATEAAMNRPDDVFVDREGNVFIADSNNYRVRKVDAAAGTITTVAGNGEHGVSGDGGLATEAPLALPTGVAVDRDGRVYIADLSVDRVRRVGRDGVITTFASTGEEGFRETEVERSRPTSTRRRMFSSAKLEACTLPIRATTAFGVWTWPASLRQWPAMALPGSRAMAVSLPMPASRGHGACSRTWRAISTSRTGRITASGTSILWGPSPLWRAVARKDSRETEDWQQRLV